MNAIISNTGKFSADYFHNDNTQSSNWTPWPLTGNVYMQNTTANFTKVLYFRDY